MSVEIGSTKAVGGADVSKAIQYLFGRFISCDLVHAFDIW
jgi:hypothetical protein